jgi:hypothetical protein
MIDKLFNHPHVLYQTADDENDLPELPIGSSLDNFGMIILSQEGNSIVVNRASVPELCKLLRELAKMEIGE